MIKRLLILAISAYQKVLSPDHSFWAKQRFPYGYCRFTPSCSEYTKESIEKHGPFFGLIKGLLRIIKCNPFSKPGLDPVVKER